MAASGGRIAPFLHICLQSGSDTVLTRMNRAYTTRDYASVVNEAKSLVPHIALGTDVIVGFPGESQAEYEESLAFCKDMGFSRMHVFRYSKRPGTPAAEMPCQVDPHIATERARQMHALAHASRLEQAKACVGRTELLVMQSPSLGVTGGLFDAQLIEPREQNSCVMATITGVTDKGILLAAPLAS